MHTKMWIQRPILSLFRLPGVSADSWPLIFLLVPDKQVQFSLWLPPNPPTVSGSPHVPDWTAVYLSVHLLFSLWWLFGHLHRGGGIHIPGYLLSYQLCLILEFMIGVLFVYVVIGLMSSSSLCFYRYDGAWCLHSHFFDYNIEVPLLQHAGPWSVAPSGCGHGQRCEEKLSDVSLL